MVITSKDNEIVKHIRKLSEKKYREESREFIIEGIKLLEEAINENAKIEKVIICDDCNLEGTIYNELKYEIAKLDCIYVSEKIFKLISDVKTPQGIMAIIKKEDKKEEIKYDEDLTLILDNIQDPGNMGTILRTADSLNLKQVIISKGSSDVFSPKVVRSTMGAIFRINIIESDDLVKTVKELKKHKIKIIVTSLDTNDSIYDINYSKSAIVIGNEANGVSKEIQDLADNKVKIPMIGKTESLNASVATSVILYEAMRDKLKNK